MKGVNCLSFLLFLGALLMVSCNKVVVEEPQKEDTFTQVSFGFSGNEFLTSETSLTRAGEAKDWYAFQVYSRAEGSNSSYSYYAYGFFDNKNDMVINLKNGYEYRFDVCMVVDASQRVYKFCLMNSGWAGINNTFVISSTEYVRYMYEGYLYMNYPSYTSYNRPRVDRFMGRTDGYVPTEGGVVNIDMKRVAFAVRFAPKDFVSGSLEISIEDAGSMTMKAGTDTECQDFISFKNTYSAMSAALKGNEYSESIPINVVWIKDDGSRSPIANEAVSFKRNVLTTVEFEVKESSASSTFNLSANETMGNGDTVTIEGDGTNTGVNPN